MRLSIKVGLLALVFLTATIILLGMTQLDRTSSLYYNINGNSNRDQKSTYHAHNKTPSKSLNFTWGPTDHSPIKPTLTTDTRGLNDISSPSSIENETKESINTTATPKNNTSTTNTNDKLSSSDSQNKFQCRNTVQGTKYISDDQGNICLRSEVDRNGCCIVNSNNNSTDINVDIFKRFSCHECSKKFHCCKEYEFCVSCCMGSDKVPILEEVLGKMLDKGISPNYLRNQFELCTMTCRTSSRSLIHQREYIEPDLRFCYGTKLPP